MAELKRIDEAKQESKKLRDLEFKDFPLEQFSDVGKVANEGDPHLKVAADTELYDLEKHAIQIDIDKHKDMKIPVITLMTIPAYMLMIIPAKALMIIYNRLKLVMCNHPQLARNTMLIMMIIHCVRWFTDQHMYHTTKTARNYCCCKQQICHVKTILKLLYKFTT